MTHATRNILVLLGLGALPLAGASCAVEPPHYVGEMRSDARDEGNLPSWTAWGVKTLDGYVYVTGTGTGLPRREDARRAAEADARNRLAASLESRIVSQFEHQQSSRTLVRSGSIEENVDRQQVHSQVLSLVDEVLQGTKPQAEHFEEYERFGEGWSLLYDCWILLRLPQQEYERQLAAVRLRRDGSGQR